MSYPIYYVPSGDVLPILFDTFAGSTGASITLTGLAVTDIEIYKDGGVTQRASDAGYTLLDTDGIDFDGITGIHGFSIDTGNNTDAGFYEVGAWYHVVVSSVTVDSQTVNFIAAAFRITAAENSAGVPDVNVTHWDGSAVATPTVAGVPEVDVTHFNGTAGTFSSGRPEVNTTHVGGTIQTAGDIIGDTNDIQTRLPAALVGGRIDANVGAISADSAAADNLEAALDGTGGVTITAGVTGNITGNLSGSVGSVTGAVTVGTNNDKSGYSLTATTGLGNQTANITGNLSGSVGSVTGAVGSVTGAVGSVAAAVTVGTNNDKTGYALTAGERNSIADALLDRDMSTGTDSGSATVRTVRQALRFLRNKWSIAAGTLTVTKEDDTTTSWTGTVTTAASDPVSAVDPASS